MTTPFLGQIEIFAFNFPPKGWAQCNGQLLAINQNQALFSLLGVQFGGDGRTTFALPDMRGRIPISQGQNVIGQPGGEEFHTLSLSEMPSHNHLVNVDSSAGATSKAATPSTVLGPSSGTSSTGQQLAINAYGTGGPATALDSRAISNVGGSQAHENRQPFLALNFCMALTGNFPSRN
jgi:microcystin-dependent protein